MSQVPGPKKPELSHWLKTNGLDKYETPLSDKCGIKGFDDLLLLLTEAQMRETGKLADMLPIDRYKFMKAVVQAKQTFQSYTDEQVQNYFKSFDTDGDGVVSKEELTVGLKKIGITVSDDMVDRMLKNVDEDGNGELDFDEFKTLFNAKTSHTTYTEEELKGLYKSFDTDGDGTVSKEELKEGLKKLGRLNITNEQVENLLKNVDEDGNGELDYDEFVQLMTIQLTYTEQEIKELFKSFDVDGDGQVTTKELKEGFIKIGRKNISDQDIDKMLKNVDEDGNGELDYDEFRRIFL